jgi:hypothetical protein
MDVVLPKEIKKKVLYVALRDIKEIIVPVESECLNIIFKSSKI